MLAPCFEMSALPPVDQSVTGHRLWYGRVGGSARSGGGNLAPSNAPVVWQPLLYPRCIPAAASPLGSVFDAARTYMGTAVSQHQTQGLPCRITGPYSLQKVEESTPSFLWKKRPSGQPDSTSPENGMCRSGFFQQQVAASAPADRGPRRSGHVPCGGTFMPPFALSVTHPSGICAAASGLARQVGARKRTALPGAGIASGWR